MFYWTLCIIGTNLRGSMGTAPHCNSGLSTISRTLSHRKVARSYSMCWEMACCTRTLQWKVSKKTGCASQDYYSSRYFMWFTPTFLGVTEDQPRPMPRLKGIFCSLNCTAMSQCVMSAKRLLKLQRPRGLLLWSVWTLWDLSNLHQLAKDKFLHLLTWPPDIWMLWHCLAWLLILWHRQCSGVGLQRP